MPDCEWLSTCPFFNEKLPNMPNTAELTKKRYCLEEFDSCARFVVRNALGKDKVPADMFPDQDARARAMIDAD